MTEMSTTFLEPLLASRANRRVVFLAAPDVDKLGQSLCAFLNGEGGSVVIGIRESGAVVGVTDPKKIIDAAKRELQQRLTPPSAWAFTTFEHKRKSVIVVEVPRGPRPPYVWGNVIYIRAGAANRAASPKQISELITTRMVGERWERLPALGVELRHLDRREIAETVDNAVKRYQRPISPSAPELALEDLGLSAAGQLRNSALVLFGENPARWYPQARMHLAAFKSTTPGAFLDNRIVEGNAFHLFAEADSFVRRHVSVASEMPTKTMVRADRPTFPYPALREGILNAIVHRDYSAFDGGLWISIFSDRIEILNAGTLPADLTPADLKRGYVSRPPNPDIAYVFFLRGLIEHWGLGTRRILDECAQAGLPEPTWDVSAHRVKLTIRASKKARVEAPVAVSLNSRQQKYLKKATGGSAISVSEYHRAYARDISDRQARTDLQQLVQAGYLAREGAGSQVVYVRTKKKV